MVDHHIYSEDSHNRLVLFDNYMQKFVYWIRLHLIFSVFISTIVPRTNLRCFRFPDRFSNPVLVLLLHQEKSTSS